VKQAKRDGHRVVLLSEGIREIVERLGEVFGADQIVCNRLEYERGECTGKLLEPVVGGHDTGKWLRSYATEHGIDLAHSTAYAAYGADLLVLSAVGRPCAVNPDFALRAAARDADWPVLEYR
jgi:phosphoserine phosphatase